MTKKRKTFSVDEDVYEYLQQEHVNASGLVNSLVKQHRKGGVTDDVIREFRRQQVESEMESLEEQLSQKESELQRLESFEVEKENERMAAVDSMLDEIANGKAVFPPDHPMVQDVARHFDGQDEAVKAIKDRAAEREDITREVIDE